TPDGGRYLAFGGGDPPDVETPALIATCQAALPAHLAVWDDSVTEFMEVLVRKGAVELKDGTLRIRDYFRDKLKSSAQRKQPPDPETQHGPTQLT
ncbi:MAG: hypothetical protein ACRDGM_20580, partial [bacterium]